jgi:uncharacterized protein YqhQ
MSGSSEQDKSLAQYGGQAIVEGVMMRSPHYFAVACRKPDGGIIVKCEEIAKTALHKLRWLNKPFLRGTFALLDAMILGGKALAFASNVQMEGIQTEEEKRRRGEEIKPRTPTPHAPVEVIEDIRDETRDETPKSAENGTGKAPSSGRINDIAVGGTIVFSLVISMLIFRVFPTWLTEFVEKRDWVSLPNDQARNATDGFIRMSLFFIYIILISQLDGIRRVFQYHGAEHKAINTLEAGLPLTPENSQQASRIHPRCGTSFIFVVLAIDLLVCLMLPRPPLFWRILLHLAILPFVAGLSYEVIKAAGKYRKNPLVMAIFAPGMWSQLLTTREPSPDQTEVSLAALHAVLAAEGRTDLIPQTTPNPSEPAAVLV